MPEGGKPKRHKFLSSVAFFRDFGKMKKKQVQVCGFHFQARRKS